MGDQLGRVVEPEALEASEGTRGRVRIDVPAAWLAPEAEIEVTVPARIVCARCDGGGCDACARSGALRPPDEPTARTLRMRLPATLAGTGAAIRLVHPFGEAVPIEQLIIELRVAEAPSPGVSHIPTHPATSVALARWRPGSLVAAALALAAALAAALSRGCWH